MAFKLSPADANKIWDEFLTVWPLERLATMKLNEYTEAGSKDTFTYWIESRLEQLGSIWGGSAFKFGVFSRAEKLTKDKPWDGEYNDHYGWHKKYGETAEQAFQQVRNLVAQTATAARLGDLNTIEGLKFGTAYKWKIAFHYQNRQAPTILPVFKQTALAHFLQHGKGAKAPMPDLYHAAFALKPPEEDLFRFAARIWEAWESSSRVWKVSHDPEQFTQEELGQLLAERRIAVPNEQENRTAEKFQDVLKVGDLFYLTHGRVVQLIGRISSNANPFEKRDGWSCREYEVLKPAVKTDHFDSGAERLTGWMPGSGYQFFHVPVVSMSNFERKVLAPYFDMDLEELFELNDAAGSTIYLDIALTKGAIANGYLHFPLIDSIFPNDCYGEDSGNGKRGKDVVLETDTGEQYPTDIRVSANMGKVRARFGNYFKLVDAQEGDVIRIIPTGGGHFMVKHIPGKQSGTADTSSQSQRYDTGPNDPAIKVQPNRILYGPPGTGKTFKTAEVAVEICDGGKKLTRQETMRRYEELRREGRISFVTFHQSYSYEEFVEGIRPESQDGHISYRVRPGIFRQTCDAARRSTLVRPGLMGKPLKDRVIYKMSLGIAGSAEGNLAFQECVENGYVLLGWGEDVDFSECTSAEEIRKKVEEDRPDIEKPESQARYVGVFKNELKVGDIIVVSQGNRAFRAIAEVTGEYEFLEAETAGEFHQMRPVRWLAVFEFNRLVEELYDRNFVQSTLYRLDQTGLKLDVLEKLIQGPKGASNQAFVLIIDEINRANISKVFGELITLLEPDKREGAANALTVKLPYSGDDFSVPPNLAIVGTMNTADRSIALLDTALRRRFDFEELRPDSSVFGGTDIAGVDLAAMLDALNYRIEYLYDRDHTIGHAYLLGVSTLAELDAVFRRKVIPLLQEYFYEDWSKIRVALNDKQGLFVESRNTILNGLEPGDDIYEPRPQYTVRGGTFPTEAFLNIYK